MGYIVKSDEKNIFDYTLVVGLIILISLHLIGIF